jgi:hypothetical protein
VRTGGGFILLDKFIEINAPLEEARLIRANNLSEKYKSNPGVNKVIGSDKNLYELQSAGNGRNVGVVQSKSAASPKKKNK